MFKNLDRDYFIKNVTDFLVVGTGGEAKYMGRDMASAHKKLKITSTDFLEAGHDVKVAMKNLGHGEDEIQEVICALVSFTPKVIIDM